MLGAALTATLAGFIPLTAATAATPVAAPRGLTVVRDAAQVDDVQIRWNAVSGVDHYMVRVNDGSRDVNYIVPATSTSMVHHGAGTCTTYRVTVAAVAPDKTQASTGVTTVRSLAPGGVSGLNGGRTQAGTAATVGWSAPSAAGYTPVTGYRVSVTQVSNGRLITSRTSADAVETLTGLDPTRMYVAKVTAVNAYGSCVTSSFTLGNNRPASPVFTVVRSTAQTSTASVSWNAPRWTGYGPITSYRVGVKSVVDKSFTWYSAIDLARTRTVGLLDPTRDWQFVMRAVSGSDEGLLSSVVVLHKSGYSPINASVKVAGGNDTITVDFSSPVGSSTNYPKAKVSVARSNGTVGWSDTTTVTNGAGQVLFLPVPCGTWEVTVTGIGKTSSQELVRTTARVCTPAPVCFVSTLQNGGFEQPVLPAKTYRFVPSTTSGLTWQNTAESVVEVWSTGFGGVPAPEGNQFAELNANKAGTLYQDLSTTPGTTMRWHLKHRGRSGTDTMRVLVGKPTGTLTQSGPNLVTPNTAWVQYTGAYTIPAGQTVTRFAFQAVSAGSYGNFLDDVVFTPESCQ
jgi:hypothetical protein